MKTIPQDELLVIKRIQESIPKYLTDNVTEKVQANTQFIEMLKLGVQDPEFSEETRAKWQMILDSKVLEKEMEVENPYISAEINAFVELEMVKAIVRKELPKTKQKRENYETLFRRYNKLKKDNDKRFNRKS